MATKVSVTIPPTSWAMVDLTNGTPTIDWWNFFYTQSLKLGGTSDASLATVAAEAAAAQATANAALTRANLAEATAIAAEITAGSAQTTANTAIAAAAAASSLAGAISTAALLKTNNLSDVANVATSRTNLGLDTFPFTFQFDTFSSGLIRNTPLVCDYTMPTNFSGTTTWCNTVPFANAIFTVQYVRGGVTTVIGTIILIHGGQFSALSGTQTSLIAGDILQVMCPSPADTVMAGVGITLRAVLA